MAAHDLRTSEEKHDDLLASGTIEALITFIESQCTVEEVLAVFGKINTRELEKHFKIKEGFTAFYNRYNKSGQAKLKAKMHYKAMGGNAELLKFTGKDTKPIGKDAVSVIELPSNGRIKQTIKPKK